MAFLVKRENSLVIYEDRHLLAVNKPPSWSTHAPGPYAGEGIYEWLVRRKPEWESLALVHRLDQETSGILVLSKTREASRALSRQFEDQEVEKVYVLVTDRPFPRDIGRVASWLVRSGSRYRAVAGGEGVAGARYAVTEFRVVEEGEQGDTVEAMPRTGRTHQLRVHAVMQGCPIRGDSLYGGMQSHRLHLHARRLTLKHPESGTPLTLEAEVDFSTPPSVLRRAAVIDREETDAYRCLHGASDGWPGWYVDCLGSSLLSQSEERLSDTQYKRLEALTRELGCQSAYHKIRHRAVREASSEEAIPRHVLGKAAPESFAILENRVRYEVRPQEGYSFGLFLDQRENRRRLLTNYIAKDFRGLPEGLVGKRVLNAFAYTCGFSVCAALAGATVTSQDLSRRYLQWGEANFRLNKLDPGAHDFIYGDAFDWLRRLAKKGRVFDAILLDPPTFSQAGKRKTFQVIKHLGDLIQLALPLLARPGLLFVSTNAQKLSPDGFMQAVHRGIDRPIAKECYIPQPPDFPIGKEERGHLKSVWLRLE